MPAYRRLDGDLPLELLVEDGRHVRYCSPLRPSDPLDSALGWCERDLDRPALSS
jgi:hypothetical protein